MKIIIVLTLIILIVLVINYTLYKRELILASPVKGQVMINGEPAALAEINQEIVFSWRDKIFKAETKSDMAGNFSLSAITHREVLAHLLPHQPNIKQTIFITYNGVEYPAWFFDKSDYLLLSEIDGKPINLVCELTNKKDYLIQGQEESLGNVPYGICRLTE